MKRVMITEKQFKSANQRLASTEELNRLRKKLDKYDTLVTKDKLRVWMQQIFVLGQLLMKVDEKDIFAKEAVYREYDNIIKKLDDMTN